MLEIHGLTKKFDAKAAQALFSNVSLRLSAGECVAIMGESGVGKSTLLNCVAGLETVDAGSIRLDGTELVGLDDDGFARLRRRKFGFVFQAFHLLPHLTLAQNVALPLWLLDCADAEARDRARRMLAQVGLDARADDWPRHLSGGEMQRVAIARALVGRPALVLADEPTGNLDSAHAAEVLDLLLDCVRDAGAMGIIVTHSYAAAARADRVLRLTPVGMRSEAVAA